MCMGVAPANSILVVSFARARMNQGASRLLPSGSRRGASTRFRAVLMTAVLAMGIGMLPMSLGLGEGGEQNAPLGRAVIGGLLLATVATLVFVPAVFAAIHGRRGRQNTALDSTPCMLTDEPTSSETVILRSNMDQPVASKPNGPGERRYAFPDQDCAHVGSWGSRRRRAGFP